MKLLNSLKDAGLNKYDAWGAALAIGGTILGIAIQGFGIVLGSKANNQRMIDQQNKMNLPQE